MKEIRLGVVGVGQRGYDLLKDVLTKRDDIKITAICDISVEKAEKAAELVNEKLGYKPAIYTDYKVLFKDNVINTVLLSSSWITHVPMAIDALDAKIAVALEVGGAYTEYECWKLVEAQERNPEVPFMFMENCCYGRLELCALNIKEQGLFGEIVHCTGGYLHDIRNLFLTQTNTNDYRLLDYCKRNCENYPTHEIGPLARILNINRGNRMLTLSSFSSKSAGMHQYALDKHGDDPEKVGLKFALGDVVTTVIKCANGETITLELSTSLPRFYSRNFGVQGTKGMIDELSQSLFFDEEEFLKKEWDWETTEGCAGNLKTLYEKYDHPLWKDFSNVNDAHGGIDWLIFDDFINCLKNDLPMPIDVYDAASWMVISPLSENSIATGGAPVAFPDFTRGKWTLKK